MVLVNSKDILNNARENHYAVAAFNVNNMEAVQAVVQAAVEEKAPVIIQCTEGAIKYAGLDMLRAMVNAAAGKPEQRFVLHLDHGKDMEIIKSCIDGGFTSVMIDASSEDFEANVARTKEVVDLAHPKGLTVEAELGQLKGVEDNVASENQVFTDPEKAKEFVERTGCDSLAIAIGTSHGAHKFKGEPHLDMERLSRIREVVKIPLVLHGASRVPPETVSEANHYGGQIENAHGVPDEMLAEAVRRGICKVNTDTDLRLSLTAGLRKALAENPSNFDPRKELGPAREAMKEEAKHRIRVVGSSGRFA